MTMTTARASFFLLAVPAFAFVVALGISHKDSQLGGLAVAAALVVAAAGLALLSGIKIASYFLRVNRHLLLAIFRPGLYITLIAVAVLVLAHAALLVGTTVIFFVVFGGHGAIGVVVGKILIPATIGALVGVVAMFRASTGLVNEAWTMVLGVVLPKRDHPLLWGLVEDVARKIGASPPKHIVAGLEPNFFVTDVNVLCMDEQYKNAQLASQTMYISFPLCRILTSEEFASVIGHELGHYIGLDTHYSRKFYPIYRGTVASLAAIGRTTGRGARGLALLPAVSVLSFFLESFAVAERTIGRERELAADAVAARDSGTRVLAAALVKIHAFSACWHPALQAMADAMKEKKPDVNLSLIFAESASQSAGRSALQGLDDQRLPHPTDSHPPLSVRLETLGISVADVAETALRTAPESRAITLIENHEKLERALTEIQWRHIALAAVATHLNQANSKATRGGA